MNTPETYDSVLRQNSQLPVADPPAVRRHVAGLLKRHRGTFTAVILLNSVAALAALVGPQVLGKIVQGVTEGLTSGEVNKLTMIFVAALVVQTIFTRWARLRAAVLGEWILADLREDLIKRAVGLPLGVVERAGTGDLVSRATTDVDRLAWAVRMAVPEMTIAVVTGLLVGGALILTAPLLALAWLLAVPPIVLVSTLVLHASPQRLPAPRPRPTRWSTLPSPRPSTPAAPWRRTASARSGSASPTGASHAGSAGSATRCGCAPTASRPSRPRTSCRPRVCSSWAASSTRRAR